MICHKSLSEEQFSFNCDILFMPSMLHSCRKFSRLQIQYSRIRHVPVQYTISQSGEMEEEEGDVQPMVDITRVEDETSQ